jgi:hypothetical protein
MLKLFYFHSLRNLGLDWERLDKIQTFHKDMFNAEA